VGKPSLNAAQPYAMAEGRVFLLVPAYPGCPGTKAVKRWLLLLLLVISDWWYHSVLCISVVYCPIAWVTDWENFFADFHVVGGLVKESMMVPLNGYWLLSRFLQLLMLMVSDVVQLYLWTSHAAHPSGQYAHSLSAAAYLDHLVLSCCLVKECTLPVCLHSEADLYLMLPRAID